MKRTTRKATIHPITGVSVTIPFDGRSPYINIHRGKKITTLGSKISYSRLEGLDNRLWKLGFGLPLAIVCSGHVSLDYAPRGRA